LERDLLFGIVPCVIAAGYIERDAFFEVVGGADGDRQDCSLKDTGAANPAGGLKKFTKMISIKRKCLEKPAISTAIPQT
jgi:hypothetical protein